MTTQLTRHVSRFRGAIVALALAGLAFSLSVPMQAQTENLVHSFTGVPDGGGPECDLVADPDGNLYGTTIRGGPLDAGTVFELTKGPTGWQETILYSFTNQSDGAVPENGVVFGPDGSLYGVTATGGSAVQAGTVFRLKKVGSAWKLFLLHTFTGAYDGAGPIGPPVMDAAGNLYGATSYGGRGRGVVYELSPSGSIWKLKTLVSFNGPGGAYPMSRLTIDAAGNLYGTTNNGGFHDNGVVFRLSQSASGWKETVLHTFSGGKDGAGLRGSLTLDTAGRIYGTTVNGGNMTACSGFGCGTVFSLTPVAGGGWKESVLHEFTGGDDGAYIYSTPTFDQAGNLYATAYYGGNLTACDGGCGTVFRIGPPHAGSRTFTVLHTFTGGTDGIGPYNRLLLDSAGNLFGTALNGGSGSSGVVFEITP